MRGTALPAPSALSHEGPCIPVYGVAEGRLAARQEPWTWLPRQMLVGPPAVVVVVPVADEVGGLEDFTVALAVLEVFLDVDRGEA